jgi:hypothetical protein
MDITALEAQDEDEYTDDNILRKKQANNVEVPIPEPALTGKKYLQLRKPM